VTTKYKEIDVFMTADSVDNFGKPNYRITCIYSDDHGFNATPVKCKLIIPVKEKKITITESMLDEAFNGLKPYGNWVLTPEGYEQAKQKLFHGWAG
jgi:hypothetical protein